MLYHQSRQQNSFFLTFRLIVDCFSFSSSGSGEGGEPSQFLQHQGGVQSISGQRDEGQKRVAQED